MSGKLCSSAASSAASASAGTFDGETKAVASISRTPVAATAASSSSLADNGIGSSICSPSRSETSRMSTCVGSAVIGRPPHAAWPARHRCDRAGRRRSRRCAGRAGRPGAADGSRRIRKHRYHAGALDVSSDAFVPVVGDHPAGLQLCILDDLGDGVDRSADHAGLREGGDDIGGLAGGCPVADDLVELILIAPAGNMIDEPVVGGELGLFHRGAQPAEHGVLIGGDDDPAAVCGRVDVRRGDALKAGAGRPADHAAHVVVRNRGFLYCQTGFGERRVDHLTLAGDGASIERSQCTLGGEHPGQAVAE